MGGEKKTVWYSLTQYALEIPSLVALCSAVGLVSLILFAGHKHAPSAPVHECRVGVRF